ncbi:MAG: hypothetical protein SPL35_02135 [Bacteroidales bacterium]|nr:hypothetical protein [Bacteroidales bacterium]
MDGLAIDFDIPKIVCAAAEQFDVDYILKPTADILVVKISEFR